MVGILTTVALVSGGILALLLLLSIVLGMDFDLDVDTPDADTGGVGWVKGILAFVAAGTYATAIGLKGEFHPLVAILIGIAAGSIVVWILSALLKFLLGRQENTNWEMTDALGNPGKVYLKIPAYGQGIVRIEMRGAARELKARSKEGTELRTGTPVRVVGVENEIAWVVAEA